MKHTTPVVINGRHYDPATGMPMQTPAKQATASAPAPAQSASVTPQPTQPRDQAPAALHKPSQQRSQTLSRRSLVAPHKRETAAQPATPLAARPAARAPQSVERHASVTKFAPHPKKAASPEKQPAKPTSVHDMTRPAEVHPTVARAQQRALSGTSLDVRAPQKKRQQAAMTPITHATKPRPAAHHVAAAPKPAKELKQDAITAALKQEVASTKPRRQKKPASAFGRWLTVGSASLAVLVLGAYFTYLNMPNLSVRVAAVQSGIDAKYPGYRPDGYSLSGPIAFKEGQVDMKFAYNGGGQNFTLSQQKSSWDSSAAGAYAEQQSNGSATTVTADGLTIYLYDGNALWVNGGVLYSIRGDAPLSSDQVRRLATSL